ncbi:ribonuclease HI family protein [Virgibacillus kimchii]
MIEVYTDGASRGNPGLSGAGIYIKDGKQQYEYAFPLGKISNHEAEFLAVIKALEICEEFFPGEIISIRSDSKIAVEVIEKNYTKNAQFLPFLETIQDYIKSFPYAFFKWIPEKQNKHADMLAKKGIQMNEGS